MKIVFISLVSLVFSLLTPTEIEQTNTANIPLCHGGATDMADFAGDPAFRAQHAEPLPFNYVSAAGEMITFNAPDGKAANGFLLKAKKPSNKWLFVYQEWWGLNDYIKKEAEKFHGDLSDVNVLAVDMYDGAVATKQEDAAKLMQGADKNRLNSIIKGAIAYAGPEAEIASVGWCFGGGLSLQSAILEGKQAKGCVMYYGFPEMDVEKLKTLQTDVLGLFASKDGFISPKVVGQFEENMKKAGEKIEVKMYEADHAFANPSNPKFDKEATADAYKRALTYLKSRLKA
ncbi:dienelactone hydrolase family protein [Rudanella paleaurantiibacter]|uniref:Dienelactone hydrolase family protein n=1 Tax=Rudanella paleaurantiibacter TaxID=2614655 RepID=A0A7J5TWJ7_9BACT|nr:dienelactone hydrolase family protein [Rudanella paleaurantiibacter]KAB7729008.1 dienelactone hydrolase family protein [Rudanella paleaurantiibacter]